MDWKRAIEEERAALGHIVALLFSLADLAERTAGRSTVVASLVLWFLRQAEAVARDFVDGRSDAPSASMPIVPTSAGPLDAMRLAVSLRALARQIDGQARLLPATRGRTSCDRAASPSGRMPALRAALNALSSLAAFTLGAPLPAAPDTS
ncbi:hypothetical protein [Mesorhizobium sp. CAU 1732]|uniref:hypothetical protein n=1 Tax=Mesorhizobium sp. CAU 1732 TaxID=3140358 RepID=UPI003260226F